MICLRVSWIFNLNVLYLRKASSKGLFFSLTSEGEIDSFWLILGDQCSSLLKLLPLCSWVCFELWTRVFANYPFSRLAMGIRVAVTGRTVPNDISVGFACSSFLPILVLRSTKLMTHVQALLVPRAICVVSRLGSCPVRFSCLGHSKAPCVPLS